MIKTNFLVIGSGIAGLNFALHAAKKGRVLLVTKKNLIDSATNYAQGGIAGVLDRTDEYHKLVKDTLKAGSKHNKKSAVRFMAKNSRQAIYRLIELGVQFAKENGELLLTQEGGHSQKRIAYVGDYTGKEIESILVKRVKEHINIEILEDCFVLDLIARKRTCYGASVLHKNKIHHILANQTVLATGGVGQIFGNTTNPKISTGDGIAMGARIGCKVKDLEFIQFHPTALDKKISPRFLISEAVRGEGGKLINSKGEYFMTKHHPQKDLAPRDIVSQTIYHELESGPVYLDIRQEKKKFLKKRFPKIYQKLNSYGIRMEKDLIPVTPAAHYVCGGLVTDLNGKTNIKNLFAFGEVSRTGVHGANRLASNSLLEALVFSNQISKQLKKTNHPQISMPDTKIIPDTSIQTKAAQKLKRKIQKIMWKYAGIVRNREQIAKEAIPRMIEIISELSFINGTNQTIQECRNMSEVGLLILNAAQNRKKSLGCHFVS